MGTRSDIIVDRGDGTFARIYCHWDGYPSHHGPLLTQHYATQELANALVGLGDLSSLNEQIGVKHPFDRPSMSDYRRLNKDGTAKANPKYAEYMRKYGQMCNAYGRDRGEHDVDAKIGQTLHEIWPDGDTGSEYTYVFTQGKWWVGDADEGVQSLRELTQGIIDGTDENAPKPNIKAFGLNFVIGTRKSAPSDQS